MTRKLTILSLAAASILSMEASFAQDKDGSVPLSKAVPTHEFFIEGFGGMGPLIYRAEGRNSFIGPGYGGGVGYIWHATPVLGLMTGAEFTACHGGLSLEGTSYEGIDGYHESLSEMAVLFPLMLHVMVPVGEKGHSFYTAVGGKAGINVHAVYTAGGDNLRDEHTGEGYDTFDLKGNIPLRRFFPAVAAEVGFRWRLRGLFGLYTGLYADYGFLGRKEQPGQQHAIPVASSHTGALGAGLKVKFAFGKARKVPEPVFIPGKPDTVVKTVVETIIIRDTVTRQDTRVIHETVEKVKEVRDTVVVVKEVPQTSN